MCSVCDMAGGLGKLEELLNASKTADGRQDLYNSGALANVAGHAARLLQASSSSHGEDAGAQVDQLLTVLRLLRNCCAVGPTAARVLLDKNIQEHTASYAAQIAADEQHLGQQQVLLAAVQLLSNMSATGSTAAAAVWVALFPSRLNGVLETDDVRVHEALALTALSCIRAEPAALSDLTSRAARTAWLRWLAPLMPPSSGPTSHPAQTAPPGDGVHQKCVEGAASAAAAASSSGVTQHHSAVAASLHDSNDNVCLLVKCVALQHNCLQQLLSLLAPCASHNCSTAPDTTAAPAAARDADAVLQDSTASPLCATEEQAVLLHVVAGEVAAVPAACALPDVQVSSGSASAHSQHTLQQQQQQVAARSADCPTWLEVVVEQLRVVWRQVVAAASPTAGVCSRGGAAVHVLEALLQVLKATLARDDDADGDSSDAKASEAAAAAGLAAVALALHHLRLTQLLLDMLTALGAPPKTKQQQQRELEQRQQQPPQEQQPCDQQPATASPEPRQHQQPYAGYRADVVAVLSNMLLGGRVVQDAVMAGGGIELLLNNCNLDEGSPLAREWALWGIRNACKDNEGVQQYITQFSAVDAVQSDELDRMGMQLELDQMSHKLKLVKKPGQD